MGFRSGHTFKDRQPQPIQPLRLSRSRVIRSMRSFRSCFQAAESFLQSAAVGIAANLSGLAQGISIAAAKSAAFWVFAAFVPVLILGLFCAWTFTSDYSERR